MVATNYYGILKARGYEPVSVGRKLCVYKKIHLTNEATIVVVKDSHCKGKEIYIEVIQTEADDGRNLAGLDNSYLKKEAARIEEAFYDMASKKSPKRYWF